jgi:methionyl-tRNA formyltransferase
MKFAFAGIDFLSGVFDGLVAAGWTPVKLFTRPCDGIYDFNELIVARARSHRIPIQLSRLKPEDVEDLARRHGPDTVLAVSGYPWLVRGWTGRLKRAFNVHPSPLPIGRGPYPLFRAVLDRYETWGVSAHVLAEEDFDTGAVLAQETFALSPDECHETLLAKCQMAATRVAAEVAADLPDLWKRALPQGDGSYWHRATDADRTLDFREGVEPILRRVRAFGAIETIARLGEARVFVAAASGWTEAHSHPPGTVVHRHRRHVVIAARDGYVQLTRWSAVTLGDAASVGR